MSLYFRIPVECRLVFIILEVYCCKYSAVTVRIKTEISSRIKFRLFFGQLQTAPMDYQKMTDWTRKHS